MPCSFTATVNLDITKAYHKHKAENIPLFAILLHILALEINKREFFKFFVGREDKIFTFDCLDPCYNILHEENKTFSSIYTTHNDDFKVFLQNYLEDKVKYKDIQGYVTKPFPLYLNLFYVSVIRDLPFTAFNIDLKLPRACLQPVITIGKMQDTGGKLIVPVSIQIHHAVADGYHIAKFVEDVQTRINELV